MILISRNMLEIWDMMLYCWVSGSSRCEGW